jgi:hypothetical protein
VNVSSLDKRMREPSAGDENLLLLGETERTSTGNKCFFIFRVDMTTCCYESFFTQRNKRNIRW